MGQVVQDAAYLVTVPHVVPEVPALFKDPVIAYMVDVFTRPIPLRADVLVNVSDRLETIVAMLACHRSQVFEWLPYEEGILDRVPADQQERLAWLRWWFLDKARPRLERFHGEIQSTFGPARAAAIEVVEVYELSEYGRRSDAALRERLFPTGRSVG